MKEQTIFLADDDFDDRLQVEQAFASKSCPYQLHTFKDGSELLSAFQDGCQVPQGLLLDMRMPRVDGFEVIQALKSSADSKLRDLPIFVMTSSDMHEEILIESGCKATNFIRKPVTYQKLTEAMEY